MKPISPFRQAILGLGLVPGDERVYEIIFHLVPPPTRLLKGYSIYMQLKAVGHTLTITYQVSREQNTVRDDIIV